MGKKSREAREQAEAGGQVFRDGQWVDAGKIEKMQERGVGKLKKMSTGGQVGVLSESLRTGKLSADELRYELETNAKKEMRKGAEKFRRKGKAVTVENLLEDYYEHEDFRELAASVGLDEAWFIKLAEEECQAGDGSGNGTEQTES